MTVKNAKPYRAGDRAILQDLLLLITYDVPLAVIQSWTDEQCWQAEKYAAKTHLRASDNIVRVPPRPDFLNGYEEKMTPLRQGAAYGSVLPPARAVKPPRVGKGCCSKCGKPSCNCIVRTVFFT